MTKTPKITFKWGMWLIWLTFIVLILFLGNGLKLNPNILPSQMIGKQLPEFSLKSLHSEQKIQTRDLLGKPGLLHLWATWCGVCLDEHETLMAIHKKWNPNIYSVSYKDQPNRALQWLTENGDPYQLHLNDNLGKLALELGVYGTPELYVIDAKGRIRYKHVGAIDMKVFEKKILPILQENHDN